MDNKKIIGPWQNLDPGDMEGEHWRGLEIAPAHEVSNFGRVRRAATASQPAEIMPQTMHGIHPMVAATQVGLSVRLLVVEAWGLKKPASHVWTTCARHAADCQLVNMISQTPRLYGKSMLQLLTSIGRRRCKECQLEKPLDARHFELLPTPEGQAEGEGKCYSSYCRKCKPAKQTRRASQFHGFASLPMERWVTQ